MIVAVTWVTRAGTDTWTWHPSTVLPESVVQRIAMRAAAPDDRAIRYTRKDGGTTLDNVTATSRDTAA